MDRAAEVSAGASYRRCAFRARPSAVRISCAEQVYNRSMACSRCLALVFLILLGSASAQTFPSRTVSLIVPNPPGGAIDIQARIYAQKLQELWGQPVVVDYKPGAGTLLGMEYTAKSAPDGHTLCLAVTPLVILPALRDK